MNNQLNDFQIFRGGSHVTSSGRTIAFGADDIAAIVEGYDPENFAAPVVVGHPATNDPAYGWVEKLRNKDGVVVADAKQVHPEFLESVKDGRYKKVSASFYTPDHPNNPKPGDYYLRHVGFLGAAAPAVKGLKSIDLDEGDGELVTIEFSDEISDQFFGADPTQPLQVLKRLAVEFMEMLGGETSPSDEQHPKQEKKTAAPAKTADHAEEDTLSKKEQEELKRLRTKVGELETENTEFSEQAAKARRDEDRAFVDGIIKKGQLAPGHRDDILNFMEAIDVAETADFAASDGKKVRAREFFKSLLEGGDKIIDLSERSKSAGADAGDGPRLSDQMKEMHGVK